MILLELSSLKRKGVQRNIVMLPKYFSFYLSRLVGSSLL